MPVAAYYLHDPAAPRPNSPTRMGTNVLLECRGRLLLEQRWDCGAWGLPAGGCAAGRARRAALRGSCSRRRACACRRRPLRGCASWTMPTASPAIRTDGLAHGHRPVPCAASAGAGAALQPGVLHTALFTPEELRTADLVPTHRDLIEAWRPAPLEVAAAMLTRGQTVLLCRRPAGKARALQWEFPGGKLEPGETGEQALARECREELGAEVRVGPRVDELVFDYPDLSVHLTLYQAEPLTEPRALEHSALDWVGPAGLERYDLCPADRRFVPAVQQWFRERE